MIIKIYRLKESGGFAIRFWKYTNWLEITLWKVNIILDVWWEKIPDEKN